MSEPRFDNALVDMLIRDGATTQPSVAGELLRQQFEGDRRIRQVESVWIPDPGPLGGGHWQVVEEIDAGPAPHS